MGRSLLEQVRNYHAILNFAELRVDEEFLSAATQLKIVVNESIGYDNLDLKVLKKRKIWARNSPGFFNFAVAEYIIAGILFLSRRMLEAETPGTYQMVNKEFIEKLKKGAILVNTSSVV